MVPVMVRQNMAVLRCLFRQATGCHDLRWLLTVVFPWMRGNEARVPDPQCKSGSPFFFSLSSTTLPGLIKSHSLFFWFSSPPSREREREKEAENSIRTSNLTTPAKFCLPANGSSSVPPPLAVYPPPSSSSPPSLSLFSSSPPSFRPPALPPPHFTPICLVTVLAHCKVLCFCASQIVPVFPHTASTSHMQTGSRSVGRR